MNKKVTLKQISCVAVAALSTASVAHAQSDLTGGGDLDEVIISASRIEQDPGDVGRSVTVISSEEIRKSPFTNISELLSEKAGFYIVGTDQNPGALKSVFLRGANVEHTVILIDGVRITDPSSVTNAVDLAELSLANIERIEIVRGSHSTLYGSSAIGGIINIITKKGGKQGFSSNVQLNAGTFGPSTFDFSQGLSINYQDKSGFYAGAEVFNRKVDGLDATVDTVTAPDVYNERDRDGFDKTDLIGKVGFRNKKWDVFGSFRRTDQKADLDDGAFNDDDNYTLDFSRNLISYQAAYNFNPKLNLTLSGGYTEMERSTVNDSSVVNNQGDYDHSFSENSFKGSVSNNELLLSYKLSNVSFVAGLGRYEETMTSKSFFTNTLWSFTSESDLDSLDINAVTNSAFLHTDISGAMFGQNLSKFNLALGGRYNDHSSFGGNFTYEINPSYKIDENSIVYASFSTGFNAPSLYRLFSPNTNFVSGVSRGNVDLEPETSRSIEFGIKQNINNKTRIGISVFQTEVDNLIEYVYLWDKSIGIDTLGNDFARNDARGDTYLNIGTQTNVGVEFTIQSRLTDKFLLDGNLSLVSGKLEYAPSNTEYTDNYHVQLFATGDFLTEEIERFGLVRRSNTANLALTYLASSKWSIKADMRYVGMRSDIFYNAASGPFGALDQSAVGDYTLVGLTASIELMKDLRATLRLDNIFDVNYQEIFGYTTRGRGVYLKINYNL